MRTVGGLGVALGAAGVAGSAAIERGPDGRILLPRDADGNVIPGFGEDDQHTRSEIQANSGKWEKKSDRKIRVGIDGYGSGAPENWTDVDREWASDHGYDFRGDNPNRILDHWYTLKRGDNWRLINGLLGDSFSPPHANINGKRANASSLLFMLFIIVVRSLATQLQIPIQHWVQFFHLLHLFLHMPEPKV